MRKLRGLAHVLLVLFYFVVSAQNEGTAMMLKSIEEMTTMTASQTGVDAIDPRVMNAMSEVDRKLFVPEEIAAYAYVNQALPIKSNQTISQPYIVALMTHLLGSEKDDRVLEIGTGSGYQAAVLSKLVQQVYSIEIIPELAKDAEERLKDLDFLNVEVKVGDGWFGWKEHAPFDSIIVTAQAPAIPDMLVDQLKIGGRMVIPVGTESHVQTLEVVTKSSDNKLDRKRILSVVFVPMTGEAEKLDP